MRLDKYLKVSRIIKRRTVAKEVCEAGRIKINGRVAKAGSEIEVGDTLEILFGSRLLVVDVVAIAESAKTDEAKDLYKVIREEKISSEQI